MGLMRLNDAEVPNLKPFRQHAQEDVINMFAHVSGSVNKGTVVKIHRASGNTDLLRTTSGHPYLKGTRDASRDGLPSYIYTMNYEVDWKLQNAVSGDKPLGVTLNDVRTNNAWNQDIYFERHELAEGDIVPSGESVPVLTRGLLKMNSFTTNAVLNSDLVCSTTIPGRVDVVTNTASISRVGKILTTEDADGFALVKIEL